MKTNNEDNNLDNLRHSTAHLLAAAILELYPNAKLAIGPSIENGFYYDIDFGNQKISEEDFPEIEEKMRELIPSWKTFNKITFNETEAKNQYKKNLYKEELIEEFSEDGKKEVGFYESVGSKSAYFNGETYRDLCKGGHVTSPSKEIKHFKLLSVAGAYWRGNEKNPMLTRIYGTVFPTKEELDIYLNQLEEAKKRDHRKLGQELDLFVFSDLVGKGLPLFTPKGTLLRELLNEFSQSLRLEKGFQKVWTPHITKTELYKVSGHWDKFGDELFLVKSQETADHMVMKPMNCPHHQQIYASKPRSYKDLPIMYMETTTIYRDEKAGELHGLERVRSATQDDSHTFCTPEQIEDVYKILIDVTTKFYDALGMKYRARLSFREPNEPKKYLGEESLWEKAQSIILKIAKESDIEHYVAPGEAAFYGPKIDFMVKDALGRERQLATPQLDFVQPKRFGLNYIDDTGKEQTPVMIHYALMGSIERFLSVYIEHTAGAFPLWLSPVQVKVLPITDRNVVYGEKVIKRLSDEGIRVELDNRSETLGSKIRDANNEKVPYMVILGDKEEVAKKIAVRARGGKDLGQIELDKFLEKLEDGIDNKSLSLDLKM